MMALATKARSFQLARAHPQAARSDLAGGDGPQRPARPVFERPVDEQDDDGGHHPHQVVLAQIGVEVEPEDVERGHGGEPGRRPGDAAQLLHEHQEDLPQSDGGQSQVEVAQLEHRSTHDEGDDPGDQGPDDERRQGGEVGLHGEDGSGVGADAVEGRVTEGQLPGLARG